MTERCAALFAVLLAACSSPTEILVVVQSDLDVPAEIDAVLVEASGSRTMSAMGSLTGPDAQSLPRTVGIVQVGERTGPLRIRVAALQGGLTVVERRVVTSFLPGETRVLTVFLSRSCINQSCPTDQACEGGRCVPESVAVEGLPTWQGSIPGFDAGDCRPEVCDAADNDCDGRVDEGFMLESSPTSCGRCGFVCELEHAVPGCIGGLCAVSRCESGWGDCNQDPTDGCEAPLNTMTNCGACRRGCAPTRANADCSSGTCEISSCGVGFGDCNGDVSDGCETSLNTLTDCGACGDPCEIDRGTGDCSTGTCVIGSCESGREDCNMDASDGCETSTRFNDMACGDCTTVCADPTPSCVNGVCR
ncbi:MAG: hypothetical protein AB7S26_13625 [Sandaracinaceae bacterium]